MKEFNYEVKDPMGFHARPAAMIYKEARRFQAMITVEHRGEEADAKEILSLMGLNIRIHDQVIFRFDGVDEDEAMKAVVKVLEREDLNLFKGSNI